MPGVRIQHPTKRNTTFTLVDGSRPLREPWQCPPPPIGCASVHPNKTYHFRLDETGSAIVSTTIWERLERMNALRALQGLPPHGFVLANVVADPPKQRVIATLQRALIRPRQIGGVGGQR